VRVARGRTIALFIGSQGTRMTSRVSVSCLFGGRANQAYTRVKPTVEAHRLSNIFANSKKLTRRDRCQDAVLP
jgi:hypothetical protein